MSFFEPLPPPPEPPASRAWAPPLWDRPSEGTLPALLPVQEIVLRTDSAVVALESLSVYPNGFVINVTVLFNPRESSMRFFGPPGSGGPAPIHRFPRFGVRFADGREGGRGAPPMGPPGAVRTDDRGVPLDPVVRPSGGGGGSHGFSFNAWVFPLPPDGPLEIFMSLPSVAPDEGHLTLDASRIRAAASEAHVIWS